MYGSVWTETQCPRGLGVPGKGFPPWGAGQRLKVLDAVVTPQLCMSCDLASALKSLCLEGPPTLWYLSSLCGQVECLQIGMELESVPKYQPCPQ